MADSRESKLAKTVVTAFTKPSTSAVDRTLETTADAPGPARHSSAVDREKGHSNSDQVRRKTSSMAGVGKAFQVFCLF